MHSVSADKINRTRMSYFSTKHYLVSRKLNTTFENNCIIMALYYEWVDQVLYMFIIIIYL